MINPVVKTLKELVARQRPNLIRYGFTQRHYDILEAVMRNWMSGGPKISAATFRSDHWKDEAIIRFLEDRNFFKCPDNKCYLPEFEAFGALLVDRRKVVAELRRDMEVTLKRAEALIKEKPERTLVSLPEFIHGLEGRSGLIDAMTLLSSANTGLHLNKNQDSMTVQYTEQVRRISKSLLSLVDTTIARRTLSPHGAAITFPSVHSEQTRGETPDLTGLQRIPDAAAKASKALSQLLSDPSASISLAKSTLEATLKWIAHKEGIQLDKKPSMPELFKLCKPFLSSASEPTFLIGRSVTSLVTEIAAARNLLGDSHGKIPNSVEPTRSEARFIVFIALELTVFLIDQWEFSKQVSGLSVTGVLAPPRVKKML